MAQRRATVLENEAQEARDLEAGVQREHATQIAALEKTVVSLGSVGAGKYTHRGTHTHTHVYACVYMYIYIHTYNMYVCM